MAGSSTLAALAGELVAAFDPLLLAAESEDAFVGFLRALGWNAAGVIQPVNDLAGLVASARELVTDEGVDPAHVVELVGRLSRAFSAIRALTSITSGSLGGAIDVNEFRADFPGQLLDFLIVDHLQYRRPKVGRLLELFGILQLRDVAQTATRPAYVRREIDWHAFVFALRDPTTPFRAAYRFGQSNFDGAAFLDTVYELAHGHGLEVRISILTAAEREFLRAGAAAGAVTPLHNSVIRWVVADNPFDTPPINAGLGVAITPETPGQKPGFAVLPFIEGTDVTTFMVAPDVVGELKAAFSFAGGVALRVRPDVPPALDVGFGSGSATGAAEVSIGVGLQNSGNQRRVLLGDPAASRLEVGKLALRGGARVQSGSGPVAFVELEAQDAAIVIQPASGEADGFLTSILPSSWSVNFGGTLGFDAAGGLYFTGSSGLEVQLPAHVSIGPVELRAAQIAIRPANDAGGPSIPVELTGTLAANLGPLKGVIENVGLRVVLTFPDGGGQLGPLDFSLGFRPPNGVGLSLDAGVVSGGGFLYLDATKGEYAGALELSLFDVVSVHAIGLISTRMPDGSRGFSLLIILTADFGAGIQLGFGFTLLAVGGLLGLNRGVQMQALLDAVKTNAISSVLFPQNVIANAPRIISDLRTFFPPQQGTFLIGPMAKLGWGEPTLVILSLGVVVEIPPADVAILGILRAALPAEDAPILVLQVSFIGVLEPSKERLYFYASLFDSHLLFITIDGQMGALFAFGDDANLVVSIGGFHPQFNPPPLPFPTPQRISFDIINESYARIQCDGYFAVTSNTVQFGTDSSYFFGFSALSVEGHAAFDALIQISPFHFIARISTSFAVKVFGMGVYGVDIDLQLDGPTPYHARGSASISFFFFSIGIGIDVTFGDSRDTTLPPIAVMPLLTTEFNKRSNWRALPPTNSNLLVSLRKLDAADAGFVLHPVGTLQVSQRAVPLDLTLDHVGAQKPSDANRFTLAASSGPLSKLRDMQESFAPVQFKDLSDADKLSAAAYVPQDSGIELAVAGTACASGTAITRIVRYDLTIIDKKLLRQVRRFVIFAGAIFKQFLLGASVARSPLSAYQKSLNRPDIGRISVAPEAFAVAFAANNQTYRTDTVSFTSQAAAQEYLTRAVQADPTLAGTLHVLPQFELAA